LGHGRHAELNENSRDIWITANIAGYTAVKDTDGLQQQMALSWILWHDACRAKGRDDIIKQIVTSVRYHIKGSMKLNARILLLVHMVYL
jgi:hypothetical protein